MSDMTRVRPHQNPHWNPPSPPTPTADHNADRKIVGTILDAKGKPLHTVKKANAVDFGYRGRPDA